MEGGHGIWVSDVFAWRASPAAWKEAVLWVRGASVRPAGEQERRKLRRLGDNPVIASMALADGGTLTVAARKEHAGTLLGPYGGAV